MNVPEIGQLNNKIWWYFKWNYKTLINNFLIPSTAHHPQSFSFSFLHVELRLGAVTRDQLNHGVQCQVSILIGSVAVILLPINWNSEAFFLLYYPFEAVYRWDGNSEGREWSGQCICLFSCDCCGIEGVWVIKKSSQVVKSNLVFMNDLVLSALLLLPGLLLTTLRDGRMAEWMESMMGLCVKWLCTYIIIMGAIMAGHLSVICWLLYILISLSEHSTFPIIIKILSLENNQHKLLHRLTFSCTATERATSALNWTVITPSIEYGTGEGAANIVNSISLTPGEARPGEAKSMGSSREYSLRNWLYF